MSEHFPASPVELEFSLDSGITGSVTQLNLIQECVLFLSEEGSSVSL